MTLPFGLGLVALLASWWLLRPRPSQSAAIVDATRLAQQRQAKRDELSAMEVRLAERSRELEAALQTRAVLLDQLIVEADERIADLRQQLEFLPQPSASKRRAA